MPFVEELGRLGFAPSQDRPSGGVRTYACPRGRFLTYWLHAYDDGSALFTWEFAVGEYLSERGIQLGSNEVLNLFMFPTQDERGPQQTEWVEAVMARAGATLGSLDFANPGD
jgi:hypothetical protein